MADRQPAWNPAASRRRLTEAGYPDTDPLPPVMWLGDGPELADALAGLVRSGRKTATSSLLWEYEIEGTPVPRPGDRNLLIDWSGDPVAVLEVAGVRIVPFCEVDAAYAREEGERDLSLESWREGHWDFFSRVCHGLGLVPDGRMPIVCVRFRVLLGLPPRREPPVSP
jgi:uncharacterized protein YhfF